jgi:hypothetical protein
MYILPAATLALGLITEMDKQAFYSLKKKLINVVPKQSEKDHIDEGDITIY